MAHRSFAEYLDNKSKTMNTGKVQKIADYSGPTPSKPGKEKKHKDAGGKGQTGEIKPYAGGTNAKDPNKGKGTDGFAGKGDGSLKYTPGKGELQSRSAGIPGGKEVGGAWPKTKTQEWIDRTKDMSLAEFTKLIQKKTTKGLNECACAAPLDTVKNTVALAKSNESIMSSLVREFKRAKSFGKLVAEMLKHEETYGVIAMFIEHDEAYARRLVRAMNEMVGPPAHKDDMDDDDDPSKPPHPEDMHGSDDDMGDDMGGDDDMMGMGDDDEMGIGGGPHAHGKPPMHKHPLMKHPKHGGPDMGDDMGDDMGGPGMGDDDMGDDMGGPGMGDDDEMGLGGSDDPMGGPGGDKDADLAPHSKIMPARKKKKKSAHHHLMNALKGSGLGGGMSGGEGGGMAQMGGPM